jgi:hypothetical protein
VEPYFTQLEKRGLVANKFAFYTRRSVIHASANPSADPLNNGFLILGGGDEAHDLYTGKFQSALVLRDDYYSVNLKQVVVGRESPIEVKPPSRQSEARTNAIVDSGTNGLDLAPALFNCILQKLTPAQAKLMRSRNESTSNIRLEEWPTITFILQGEQGEDVRLEVQPEHYWQLNGFESGTAYRVLWCGEGEQSILGLPLMNAYFTVFDRSANRGLGVVRFAKPKTASGMTARAATTTAEEAASVE